MGNIYNIVVGRAQVVYDECTSIVPKEHDLKKEYEDLQKLTADLQEKEMTKVKKEYEKKTKMLPTSYKARVARYRIERFESDDEEKYDGIVKRDLQYYANKLKEGSDKTDEKEYEEDEQKRENANVANILTTAVRDSEISYENESLGNSTQLNATQANENLENSPAQFLSDSKQLAISAENNVYDQTSEIIKNYEAQEKEVDEKALEEGERKGQEDVEKYNASLEKQANKIFKSQNKAKSKAGILTQKVLQAAKLELYSLIGL